MKISLLHLILLPLMMNSPLILGSQSDTPENRDYNGGYSNNCTIAPPPGSYQPSLIPPSDAQLLEVALNLEYLEAELFLNAAYGIGLEGFDPSLIGGGPRPIGAQKAYLDPFILDITKQLALQEVGHIRYTTPPHHHRHPPDTHILCNIRSRITLCN